MVYYPPGGFSIRQNLAIWLMLKAKPGKEADVEAFLKQGAVMAQDEPKTVNRYGVKVAPGVYGVFNTFVAYQPLLEVAILPQPEDLYNAMLELAKY